MDFHFHETSFNDVVENLCYASLFLFLAYCIVDTVSARQLVKKHAEHPFVGSPFPFVPKFIHSLIYAWKATELAQQGYEKNKYSAFQLIRNEGRVVVLPLPLLEEVSRLPSTIAEPTAALNLDVMGSLTGVDRILENRLHHSIIQRKLSPRLPLLLPRMEEAVSAAFSQYMPQNEDWSEFHPYEVLRYVSARVDAEVIVGPAFCDNKEWLHVAVEYTESLFRTVVVLRCFPTWTRPLISRLLPSYWKGWRHLRNGKELLGPKIQELLDMNNAGTWNPQDDKVEDLNVLSWLVSFAKGRDRTADTIGHVLVMVAFAAVHTTLLRMVNVLYDVTDAGLEAELLNEIADVVECGWHDNGNPYDALGKLDSVMRESQRLSPPVALGMKRLFKKSHTFQDGTHIRAGTYACMPLHAIENDPAKIPHPERFDGLRAYRAARESRADSTDEHLFSSPGPNFLSFGYGKMACPGRFFASVVIKMVVVKALTDYEFKFLPGAGRPKNIALHEFLFTWPWNKMLIRRKNKRVCPF